MIKIQLEDRASFKAKYGEELFNRYMAIRPRIPASEVIWKDMDAIARSKTAEELEDYLDNFTTGSEKKRKAKEGAELITRENGWTVYRIDTYEASTYFGRDTRWCISGTSDKPMENGKTPRETFEEYVELCDMYFFIKGNIKYCITYFSRGGNRGTVQMFDSQNKFVSFDELPRDLPEIKDIVGGGFPRLIYDDDLEAVKVTMKAFDFQHNGSYMFDVGWFTRGEIELKGGVKHCIETLLDNGYCIAYSGRMFTVRRGYRSNITMEELAEICKSTVDRAKETLSDYWSEEDNAFVIRIGGNRLAPEIKNAFKDLDKGGFKFYDYGNYRDGRVAICSEDRKYNQLAEKITIDNFFRLCNTEVEQPVQLTGLDAAKDVVSKYWDSSNDAYIIRIGRQHLTMAQMDAFETLYENGFEFYYTDNSMIGELAICSEEPRYSQIADEIPIEQFFRYIG